MNTEYSHEVDAWRQAAPGIKPYSGHEEMRSREKAHLQVESDSPAQQWLLIFHWPELCHVVSPSERETEKAVYFLLGTLLPSTSPEEEECGTG